MLQKDPNSSKWHESQSSGKIEVTDPYNGATEVEAVTLYNYARNDYIWTYLFHYFGNVKGVFLVVVFAVFLALLFRMAVKQKNRLGYMISIGCALFLILQSLFYIGVNAGLYPISGNYMPFLSHGNMTMMITYFLYGNIVIRVQKFKYCEELKSYKNTYRIAKSPHSFFDECGDFMLPGIRKKELEKFLV